MIVGRCKPNTRSSREKFLLCARFCHSERTPLHRAMAYVQLITLLFQKTRDPSLARMELMSLLLVSDHLIIFFSDP
jgi:hypothetical protein